MSSIVGTFAGCKTVLWCRGRGKGPADSLPTKKKGWPSVARRDNALPGESSRPARFPKRSRRYGVGKEIGGAVYVHRRYEHVFGSACQEARKWLPSDFRYTVVKLNVATRAFSFIQVDDFDSAPEPTIGTVIAVKPDGSCRRIEPPSDPYIYHHKWLFVADDYDGFDVEESQARSGAWLALPEVDKSRIGRAGLLAHPRRTASG
jgi:hypothetical protein